ncbi:MAG: hypothetical protein IT207_03840 [Fimbriimonadaceae bacterium]|nr:hypothetical protein [Fimbriimonadaceae bacterium]
MDETPVSSPSEGTVPTVPSPTTPAPVPSNLDSVRRSLGITVIVLGLLALVAGAMGLQASARAQAATIQGVKGVAAAASVSVSSGDTEKLRGMAEWLVREGGYSSVAFFDPQGRVFASTVATEPPATPPDPVAPARRPDGYWAPLRQGTGSTPWGWIRVTLPD